MATPGRNEPCSCGSGKKYKHCCLIKDEAKARSERETATEQDVAEKPAAAPQETAHNQAAARPAKHATQQPWKRNAMRGAQKFNIPRRSGGS